MNPNKRAREEEEGQEEDTEYKVPKLESALSQPLDLEDGIRTRLGYRGPS